ncbi:hypothetical protein [Butyrivibrio fibrisolvens]|uniref:hypothetical protein n=2 Tax=Butyrivibrio fibrisolvens TaxID=831 RepID=UPI0003B7B933|nr:hypothetical protein [Butyrivibrio fibrisolvens]
MSQPMINQVKNNNDKRETYAYLLGKYKKALREQFYFEALMIVYAMQEDRLRSMLYYLGTFDNRNTIMVSGKVKGDLKKLLKDRYGENAKLSMTTITGKMRLIQAVISWSEHANENDNEYSIYLKTLKRLMESVDVDCVTGTLNEIEQWLHFRNEVIHASMNKNLEALFEGIDERIELGMRLARDLDGYIKEIKKDNSVRKKLKMGNR